MPLSEDEQRILSQIEERFYQDDPAFARGVGETTLTRHAFRNIRWGLLGFLAGGVLLVAALSFSYLVSFVGFLVIFASAVFIERNARKLGKAGLDQVTGSLRNAGGGANLNQRFRKRFRNDDE